MKSSVTAFFACIFIPIIAGCSSRIENVQYDNGGVVVSGYNSEGYIKNTNEFPVRIECVEYASNDAHSFRPQWIKEFKPGETLKQYIVGGNKPYKQRFFVYDMNGAKIGLVKPKKEKGR
jgi:hypothetical protein